MLALSLVRVSLALSKVLYLVPVLSISNPRTYALPGEIAATIESLESSKESPL